MQMPNISPSICLSDFKKKKKWLKLCIASIFLYEKSVKKSISKKKRKAEEGLKKTLMASSSSISFHFRRTPRTWTGNLYERQEHSRAVWAKSQLLFWFDCLHNKNIKTLRICPHCLAVSLAFVHIFCLSSWCLLKTEQNWNCWSQICFHYIKIL